MKTGIIFALAASLFVGACTSQRPTTSGRYDGPYGGRYEGRNDRRSDNDRFEERIQQYANELNLSRRQMRDLKQIQDRYNRRGLTADERNNPSAYQRLQQQKRRDLMAVLTPSQQNQLRDMLQRDRAYRQRRG